MYHIIIVIGIKSVNVEILSMYKERKNAYDNARTNFAG